MRAMKSIAYPSKPLSVYRSTRSTHKASHGVLNTILDGRWPYFSGCLLFTWHDLHAFVMDWMVYLTPFQYIASFHCLFKMSVPQVLQIVAIQNITACHCNGFGITSLPLLHMHFSSLIIWSSSPLSRVALHTKYCLSLLSAFWSSTISFMTRG